MKKVFLLLLFFSLGLNISAQNFTFLTNPSFEDYPRTGKAPKGWVDCGFPGETPPDVHPEGTFSVIKEAYNGDTYLGLVVRDNDTWESVAQQLKQPIEKDSTYEFDIYLSKSDLYISTSRLTGETANYTTPSILRIWAGKEVCDKSQLLGTTGPIIHEEWKEYSFVFTAEANWDYLILEVYYHTGVAFPYNGHVMLDFVSLKSQNFSSGSLEDIVKAVKLCGLTEIRSDNGRTGLSKLPVVKNIFQFEETIDGMGLRRFVQTFLPDDVSHIIRYLEEIGAGKTATMVKKVAKIYYDFKQDKEIDPSQLEYFEKCEGPFREIVKDELTEKIISYIQRNKVQIIEEFRWCK